MADAGSLTFAAGAGVATFLAPCAYPLLPGYVGYYVGRMDATLAGALGRGAAATAGALIALGAVLAVALVAGSAILARVPVAVLDPFVGGVLLGPGVLVALDRAPEFRLPLPERRRTVAGFAVFGAGYGLAAAACVVPLTLGVVKRAHEVVGPHRPVQPVNLVAVYRLAAEAVDRCGELLPERLPREPARVRVRRVHLEVPLRRHHRLVAAARERLAQHPLGLAVRVRVGGVEKRDPELQRALDEFAPLGGRQHPVAPLGVPEAHTAEADSGHLGPGRAERRVLHVVCRDHVPALAWGGHKRSGAIL